ncbi:MAG: Ig-like domain-containing protein [Oscillospiraceae bacterium]
MKKVIVKTFSAVMAFAVLLSLSVCALAETGENGKNIPGLTESSIKSGSTDVDVNVGEIVLTFENNVVNSAVRENNMGCFQLVNGDGTQVDITVEMADDMVNPELKRIITIKFGALEAGTEYNLIISGELTAKNGNKMGETATISFTTAGAAETGAAGTAADTPTDTPTETTTDAPDVPSTKTAEPDPANTSTSTAEDKPSDDDQSADTTANAEDPSSDTASAPDAAAVTGTESGSASTDTGVDTTQAVNDTTADTSADTDELPEANAKTTLIVVILSALAATAVVVLLVVYKSRESKKEKKK